MAASFTFEHDWSSGPVTGYVPTEWIEGHGRLVSTLPGLMAISGAAVSPSMGKMTHPALRFMMAFFNVRLGVWVPNPYRQEGIRRSASERLADPIVPPTPTDEPSVAEQVTARARLPGSRYILREALGLNSLRHEFVYVSDGGHWENLGLVELLRRGCMKIVCIDGSGGDTETFATLSEAIALARSDLGVDIDIQLCSLVGKDGNLCPDAFAEGRIHYPDVERAGKLLYVKAIVPKDAPQDVLSYAKVDKRFPNISTADQFFTDKTFEAYRSLGRYLTKEALRCSPLEAAPKDRTRSCPR
jgi:hypothetical protein